MANNYEFAIDKETNVRNIIRNSTYVKNNLYLKAFNRNGVYISDVIEPSKLDDTKSNIKGSLIWNDKDIIELIHSYRFQVRQQNLERSDPVLFEELFAIGKLVVTHMFENGIINDINSDFVLSLLDTTNEKCEAQDLHTDFNVADIPDIVKDNPNVKLVLIPIANEMFLRVVKGSHAYGYENSMEYSISQEDEVQNHHFKHATVVPIKLGQYICLDPRLWHSGWTTKFDVNYRIHLYVGLNKKSLEAVSARYKDLTPGSNNGDDLFFKLTPQTLLCLNGGIQKEVAAYAYDITDSRKKRRLPNGRFKKVK